MKKALALVLALILVFTLVGCGGKEASIAFPFDVDDVTDVEMYHFVTPSTAEKKTITERADIEALYTMFTELSLRAKIVKNTAGEETTAFRFHLSDGTVYELIYTSYGAKNGELGSPTGGFKCFTSADIGWYWTSLNEALTAVAAAENELPSYAQ